jgi:hypothetical protein
MRLDLRYTRKNVGLDPQRMGHEPASVIARTGRAVIVVALCLSLGAHWALLQSLAWGSMIVCYSRGAPLAEAITKTFDGNHPCALCKHVAAGSKSDKKETAEVGPFKPDLICGTQHISVAPCSRDFAFAKFLVMLVSHGDPPPIPPPRLELA